MTTIETLAKANIPHRHHRAGEVIESFDCDIAPMVYDDSDLADAKRIRKEFPLDDDAGENATDMSEVEAIQQDMSTLGRDLFEFAVGLSRVQAKGEL